METEIFQEYYLSYQSDQFQNNIQLESDENDFVEDFSYKNLNNSYNSDDNSIIYLIHKRENSDPIIQESSPNPNIKPFEDEKVIVNHADEDSYPFNKGEGLERTLKKIGLKYIKSSNKVIVSQYDNMNIKFKTTKYFVDDKDNCKKKKKIKKKPKERDDIIRKKIKAKLHRDITNITNSKLKKKGSFKLFKCLPQCFITNTDKQLNNQVLDFSYEEIIIKSYINEENNNKNEIPKYYKETDIKTYNENLKVLKFLKEKPEICKNSEFNRIKDMKYIDILKAYFISSEFEKSIIDLHNKGEKIDYIEDYINVALSYVNYFVNLEKKKYKNGKFEKEKVRNQK